MERYKGDMGDKGEMEGEREGIERGEETERGRQRIYIERGSD